VQENPWLQLQGRDTSHSLRVQIVYARLARARGSTKLIQHATIGRMLPVLDLDPPNGTARGGQTGNVDHRAIEIVT
jgi:hypothetical protein